MSNWRSRGKDSTRHAFEPSPLGLPMNMVWETKVSGAILAPAVTTGRDVFVCSLAALYKIDAGTGTVAWEYPYRVLPKPQINSFKSSPAIVDNRVVFTDMAGTMYCVDEDTGQTMWVTDEFSAVSDSVGIYEGKIFSNGRRLKGDREEPGYLCLGLDGKMIWFREISGPNRTSAAAIAGGRLVCGDKTGNVYGIDVEGGSVVWTRNIRTLVDNTQLMREISPLGVPIIASGSAILRVGDYRNLCALDLQSGEVVWTHVSDEYMGFVANADCVAADDHRLFYAMRSLFRSLDLKSGKILLTTDNSDRELGGSRALAGIVVGHHYIAGFNMSQKVVAFNVETGEVEWEFTGDGGFTDEATYFDGGIVIGDDLGYVRRFAKGS